MRIFVFLVTDDLSIEKLKARERALESALAEFEHQARRVRDSLERSGGRSLALETELAQLEENLALTRRDLTRLRVERKRQEID